MYPLYSSSFAGDIAELMQVTSLEAFSLEEQEELYAVAYQCYDKGQYPLSAQFFTKLVSCNPFSEKYWRGLASSQQMRNEYLAAVHAWSSCALLEAGDPFAHFHAAECLFSLNEKEDGLKALCAAEGLLDKSEEHLALQQKIDVLKRVHTHG
jgi:type III secretion system low calcium response chaperone LcrH/SycD